MSALHTPKRSETSPLLETSGDITTQASLPTGDALFPPGTTLDRFLEEAPHHGIPYDSPLFRNIALRLAELNPCSEREQHNFLAAYYDEICGIFGRAEFFRTILPLLERLYSHNPAALLKKAFELIDGGANELPENIGAYFMETAHYLERQSAEQGIAAQSCRPETSNLTTAVVKHSKVGVRDIRNFHKLKKLPNDQLVEFDTGKRIEIFAYDGVFQPNCVVSHFRIAGTEKLRVPVHFFSEEEFRRLDAYANAHSKSSTLDDELVSKLPPLAWYDSLAKVIEVYIPGTTGRTLPRYVIIPAAQAKQLLASIIHESTHAEGGGEFSAYRRAFDAALKFGLLSRPVNNLKIMQHIQQAGYDEGEIVKSQDEFEACASAKERRQYWQQQKACLKLKRRPTRPL